MTINSLRQFSTTRLSNTDLGGGTVAENTMLPSGVNNAFREFMGEVAEWLVEMSYPTAGGTADALTLTPTTALAAYANNVVYTFTAASSNATTSPTLNISGLGAKQLRKISAGADVALAAGDIQAGAKYAVVYSTTANSSAGGWIVVGKDGTHLLKSANLSDLASASMARTNLGVLAISNNLSDVANAGTARTNLGLGTAATQNTGTSGTNVPLLDGANTWSAAQTIQAAVSLGTYSAPANTLLYVSQTGTITATGEIKALVLEGDSTAGSTNKAVSANFYGRDTVSTQKQTARIAAEPADLNWVGADLVLSGRVSDAVTEMLRLTGGQVKFSASASFSANGSVATALSSVGPTGAQTTVQEWLTIKNASGTVRYIPCF